MDKVSGQKTALKRIEEALQTGATKLDLEDNNLKSLPPEIGQLTKLTKLYLGENELTSLPPEFGQLTNLTTLYLRGNKIPSEFKIGEYEVRTLSKKRISIGCSVFNSKKLRNSSLPVLKKLCESHDIDCNSNDIRTWLTKI